MKPIAAAFALLFGITTAHAAPYANAKYGFSIDVPPEISLDQQESDAGDGIRSHSADGQADLAAYAGFLLDNAGDKMKFSDKVKADITSDKSDGWAVSYSKSGKTWAAYSGKKGGKIVYVREIIACSGQSAAVYRLEYPSASKNAFDPIIKKLNDSFIDGGGCM